MSTGRTSASGRVSARTIQIGLGLIWLVDGLLQLQPKMFGTSFASGVILPVAQGQPGIVSSAITHMAHLITVQPALADSVFAGGGPGRFRAGRRPRLVAGPGPDGPGYRGYGGRRGQSDPDPA